MISRYTNNSRIGLGRQLGTPENTLKLRTGIKNGSIPIIKTLIATGTDRLDSLAGTIYGDAKYWWVLAASSGIGWGLQISPGTIINIVNLSDIESLFG